MKGVSIFAGLLFSVQAVQLQYYYSMPDKHRDEPGPSIGGSRVGHKSVAKDPIINVIVKNIVSQEQTQEAEAKVVAPQPKPQPPHFPYPSQHP